MAGFCLPPPPPFLALPGEPEVPWPRWISSFETYILASDLEDVPPARKRALLVHCLGVEGQRLLGTLGPAATYKDAVKLLGAHYSFPKDVLHLFLLFMAVMVALVGLLLTHLWITYKQ